ncbi:MAG: T9SS type A sorting domain-containing protein [Bacteroidetes bacterium]|nr:T9SS type A sorting domain-containing protein [Bacteroidota bacterium]
MKKSIATFALAVSGMAMMGQTQTQQPTTPHRVCGTMDHHAYLMQNRKNYAADYAQYNQMIEQYMQSNTFQALRTASTTITIPVVIHVVYNTAAQNITDAQAISQFSVLNNDFNRLNADTVNTPTVFRSVAGGVGINFCLAQRDPSGNPTTGVIHKSTTVTSFTTDDKVKYSAQGGDDAWDVTRYMNIWVCPLASPLLGYGEFPTSSLSNTYGLVLNYTATGTMGTAQAPFNKGRTGTHEFGHCFNLIHIWGDAGQCGASDQCPDTPPQKGGTTSPAGCNYGTPTFPWQPNTCTRPDGVGGANVTNTNGDMFMNYMDYTDDAVMNIFTKNQCSRMLAVVTTAPWNVLASSNGCTPVNSYALDAAVNLIIAPLNGSSTCNNSVTPKIVLANTGTVTMTSATITYKMDATANQVYNWTGSLAPNGTTTLTLNAYTGLTSASHTFSVVVSSPNGGTDQYTPNNTLTSTFTITAAPTGSALPFSEGFEGTTFVPAGWTKIATNTLNAANTWTRVANTTGIPVTPASTACARMDNFSGNTDITGQRDALRTPPLNFTGANSSLRVRFDVSHRVYNTSTNDSLNVWISTDCGGTWSRIYNKGGASLATVTGAQTTSFTPTANTQWRRDSVNLAAYAGQPVVYLKFESVSAYGNNVYLDNINVNYVPTNAAPVASFSTASSSACSGTAVQLTDLSTNTPTTWAWSTTPAGGTFAASATAQNPTVTFAAAGTYTVKLVAANATGSNTATQVITVNATPTVSATSATVCSGQTATVTASGATTYAWNTGATTAALSVSPSATTVYTVTGTSAGCAKTATTSITVKTTPTVAVTSASVCQGSSATITASGATTYSWSTSATTASISVTPTASTVYTVTGTTNGCTNTSTSSVTVTPLPSVSASSSTICSGQTATVTATGASTYAWNTGATTAALSVSPATTTNYTVTGSAAGCSKTATTTITVKTTPTVSVNSATVCQGSAAALTASGASTYNWNTGATTASVSVSPTTTTSYTVTGTTNGCTNTKVTTVNVNALPTLSVNSATICAGGTAMLNASGAATYTWSTGSNASSISVSPSSTTTYTLNGQSSAGCAGSAVTCMVTVTSAPSISVNSSTVCSGSTATLTAAGVTSYTWNTGSTSASISVNPSATTVYTVSGNLSGCATTDVKTATVTVNTLPAVTLSPIAGPLCINSPATALNGSPAGGTYSGTGVSGSNFDPSVSGSGTFTVTYLYTDVNNCSNSDAKTVMVSNCTGIQEQQLPAISVYPNPAHDALNIKMTNISGKVDVEIYDATGRLVYNAEVSQDMISVNTEAYAKGLYTVRIKAQGKQTITRFIKD